MSAKSTPSYRRMTWTDRLIIEKLYNKGASFRSIAKMTGFCASSVYREIQHGLYPHLGAETTRRPYHYSATIAQDYADLQAPPRAKTSSWAITMPMPIMCPNKFTRAAPQTR